MVVDIIGNKKCLFCQYLLSVKCAYHRIISISPDSDACMQYVPILGAKEYHERLRLKEEWGELYNNNQAKKTQKKEAVKIPLTKRSIEF